MTEACICCANGNDLPDGEFCRACGRGRHEWLPEPKKPERGSLAEAVEKARGGPAPTPLKGYA